MINVCPQFSLNSVVALCSAGTRLMNLTAGEQLLEGNGKKKVLATPALVGGQYLESNLKTCQLIWPKDILELVKMNQRVWWSFKNVDDRGFEVRIYCWVLVKRNSFDFVAD